MWKCMTVWPALTPLLEMTRKPSSLGLGDLLDGVGHGAHGLGGHVIGDIAVVLLGDHERVDRRLGIEVVKSDDLVVLIDNGRGDLVVGDFAEDAITHGCSFLTDQGNYIWSGWLERKVVVGVGGLAVGEYVVAVDVLKEHRDLLLGIGQAGAQAPEELDAAGIALERLLKLHIARLQAADDELQLL